MRYIALNVTLALLLPLAAHKPAPHQRHACGSFVSKQQRLYVYVERGSASCPEARQVLREWFIDTRLTQRYGRWTCFDSHGAALAKGQIQHCTHGNKDEISDYDHRPAARSARM